MISNVKWNVWLIDGMKNNLNKLNFDFRVHHSNSNFVVLFCAHWFIMFIMFNIHLQNIFTLIFICWTYSHWYSLVKNIHIYFYWECIYGFLYLHWALCILWVQISFIFYQDKKIIYPQFGSSCIPICYLIIVILVHFSFNFPQQ